MTVRESIPADLTYLVPIRAASLEERPPRLLEYGVEGPALSLTACAADGTPVGYALTFRDPDGEGATLVELAVAPGHRGAGHGTALVEATVSRLVGHDRLEVTTRADDARARGFYRQNGFSFVEELPDHYRSGDGVLLVRPL